MATQLVQAPPSNLGRGSRYTGQEVERGLVALALAGGNARRAAAVLEGQGLDVSYRTLHRWAVKVFPDRYAQIRREIVPRVRRELDRQHRELGEAIEREVGSA